eukprot:TRINITY_DN51508_c0_g1_i1.p1 TRINITY_DN51508_c0_g1~~TRINITY_DN51508_c0_g1_i1.p1  ORF type:complete len:328 (-),score=46.56 TRINITY_DN51508_c0_g1_i1:304-1287(-)
MDSFTFSIIGLSGSELGSVVLQRDDCVATLRERVRECICEDLPTSRLLIGASEIADDAEVLKDACGRAGVLTEELISVTVLSVGVKFAHSRTLSLPWSSCMTFAPERVYLYNYGSVSELDAVSASLVRKLQTKTNMFGIHYLASANALLLADWNGAAVHALKLDSGETLEVCQDGLLRGIGGFTELAGVLFSNTMVRLELLEPEIPVARAVNVDVPTLPNREIRPCSVAIHNGFLQVYESVKMLNEYACEDFELKYITADGAHTVDVASMDSRLCYRHWSTMVNPRLNVMQINGSYAVIIGTTMGLYYLNLRFDDSDSIPRVAAEPT